MPRFVVRNYAEAIKKEKEFIAKGYRDVGIVARPDGKYVVYGSTVYGLFGA